MANYFQVRTKEIIPRNYNVKSFRLEARANIEYKAGQFLSVQILAEKEGKRYLSISSSPTEKGYIEFTKKITQSSFSKILNSLKPQDGLKIQYPFGEFTLEGAQTKIAFLAGGIGITPVRSICKYIVDTKLGIDISIIYANQSIRDIIFGEDFDEMQKGHPGLRVSHVLCEPAGGFKCALGLINSQIIRKEAPDYAQRKFYLSGPPSMVGEMERILTEELILPKENIVTESFQGY